VSLSSELTRRYNRSPDQLSEAALTALAASFPGRTPTEHEGAVYIRTGPHSPWTSLGEQVEVSLLRPGVLQLKSVNRPWLPLIFEHGDNVANVEHLARALDSACAAQPPCCPHCTEPLTAEPGVEGDTVCPHCGKKLFRPQLPVPDAALSTRIAAIALLLVFTLPALILLAVVIAVRLNWR